MAIDYISLGLGVIGTIALVMVYRFIKPKKRMMFGNIKQKLWEMDEKVRDNYKKAGEVHKELDELYKLFNEMEKG